jgi:Phosphotransferase enzyme family
MEAAYSMLKHHFPQCHTFQTEIKGWDSIVVNIDNTTIAKIPRDLQSAIDIIKEHNILTIIYPYIKSLTIPQSTLITTLATFSYHPRIKGGKLGSKIYNKLPKDKQMCIAHDLAHFISELHQIPIDKFKGIESMEPYKYDISDELLSLYKGDLTNSEIALIKSIYNKYLQFEKDADVVFGHFDIHSANVAFDIEAGKLIGVYDFADARIDDAYKEFASISWISFDLVKNIVALYNGRNKKSIAWDRVLTEIVVSRVNYLSCDYIKDPHRRVKCMESIRASLNCYKANQIMVK